MALGKYWWLVTMERENSVHGSREVLVVVCGMHGFVVCGI
jgi:hypothetical protein